MGIKKYLPINDPHALTVTLARYEGKNAILTSPDTGEMIWPIALLPKNADIGKTMTLKLNDESTESDTHYTHLRKLLEELIN